MSTAAAATPTAPGARIIRQERGGFFPIWGDFRRMKPRATKLLAAQDAQALAEIWDELELESEPPRLDFAEFLVLGLRQTSDCLKIRPDKLLVTAGGEVKILEEARTGQWTCALFQNETILLLAVARSALPKRFEFRGVGRDGITVEQVLPRTPQPRQRWITRDPSPPPAQVRGRVVRPNAGEAALVRLDDGAPVWLVMHENGETSAFVATRPLEPEPLLCNASGLLRLIVFDPSSRTFDAEFDEYGVNRYMLGPDLARYEVAVDPLDPNQILIGNRAPPSRRSIAVPPAGPSAPARAQLPDDPVSLADALRAAPGSTVLVNAKLVVSSEGAFVCEPSVEVPRCSPGSPPATDIAAFSEPGPYFTVGPALLARRSATGFSNLVYLEHFECGYRGPSAGAENRRNPRSLGEMGAYAVVATSRDGVLYAGGELRLGFRYVYEVVRGRTAADDVFEKLVGNNVGPSLRMRFVTSARDVPETVALISAAARVDIDGWPYRLPSVVSPLAPELGLALSSRSGIDGFLGFSAPIRYEEYELIPSFIWYGRGSTWLMLSLGGVLQ